MSFKLIIDETSLELIAKKLPGHHVYAGSNDDLLAPNVVNILGEEGTSEQWQPGNE